MKVQSMHLVCKLHENNLIETINVIFFFFFFFNYLVYLQSYNQVFRQFHFIV